MTVPFEVSWAEQLRSIFVTIPSLQSLFALQVVNQICSQLEMDSYSYSAALCHWFFS